MSTSSPPPDLAEKPFYDFEPFRVDPVRRRLLRGGEPVSLTPKAFSILLILLENRGEVVEKEDLIRSIWADAYVTEANLTQNVSSLRKALGERANDHRFVVTVPGQGYSFVAEVTEVPREEPPVATAPMAPPAVLVSAATPVPLDESGSFQLPPSPPPPPQSPQSSGALPVLALSSPQPPPPPLPVRGRRRLLLLGVALGSLLAVATVAAYRSYQDRKVAPPPAATEESGAVQPAANPRPTVAVLKFRNLSGDRRWDWLATALAEMLTTELAAGSEVRMVSGKEVARLKDSFSSNGPLAGSSLQQIRQVLGANLVVEGSYLLLGEGAGSRIRLDLRVIRAPEGDTVTSLIQVGTEEGLFELVSQAGLRLRRNLGWAPPSPEESRAVQALLPGNPEAARLYAKGLARLRSFDPQGARDLLQQATQADREAAAIRSALSQAWSDLGYDAEARTEAQNAVRLSGALSREQRLAIEARASEAAKDWAKASEAYRSLWTFYPDDLDYGLGLVNALSSAGRGAEALATVAEMRRLPPPAGEDPRIDLAEARVAKRLASFDLYRRAVEAAVRKARRSGEDQILAEALMQQGDSVTMAGRPQEAHPLYQEARELFTKAGNQSAVAILLTHSGVSLHEQGDLAAAEKAYQDALATLSRIGSVQNVATQLANLGLLYQDLGDMPRAQESLEKALDAYMKSGDRVLEARTFNVLGTVRAARGDLAGARKSFEKALAMARQTGHRLDQARAVYQLGSDLARRGELKEALRMHGQALGLAREVGDTVRSPSMMVASAEVLARLGNLPEARLRLRKALEMKRQGRDKTGAAEVLGPLAQVEYRLGNLGEAEKLSREQRDLARRIGSRSLDAMALRLLGRWSLERGDLPGARQQIESALRSHVENGEALEAVATRVELAHLDWLLGNFKEAGRLATEAADWYGQKGMNGYRAQALALRSQALLGQGRTAQAWDTAKQAQAVSERSEDLGLRIEVAAAIAPAGAASGESAKALGQLARAAAEAVRTGNFAAGLEARLVLGSLQLRAGNPAAGRAALEQVRRDAEARGFTGTAERALAALGGEIFKNEG